MNQILITKLQLNNKKFIKKYLLLFIICTFFLIISIIYLIIYKINLSKKDITAKKLVRSFFYFYFV